LLILIKFERGKMKIQFASDLHLEFPENRSFLQQNPLVVEGDVLLLAGDIIPFVAMDKCKDFFSYVADHFKTTFWVPGNHEYYHFDIAKKCGAFVENIKSNVFLLNNTTIILEEVRLIFSTLWSHISNANRWDIENGMNDFYVIKYEGNRFSSLQYNEQHKNAMLFLNNELSAGKNDTTVVITHHVPTFMNYPKKYKENALNEAFAVELFDFIEDKSPDYWIYGHTHSNTPEFNIGKTALKTNQLGYVKYNEQEAFSQNNIIHI